MNDKTVVFQDLKDKMARFVKERDWEQFHSPKNLSMALSIEAGELMEKFLWVDSVASRKELDVNRQEIQEEFADVIIAALAFVNACNIDITQAVEHKMKEIAAKYPVEKAKGRSVKYTKL